MSRGKSDKIVYKEYNQSQQIHLCLEKSNGLEPLFFVFAHKSILTLQFFASSGVTVLIQSILLSFALVLISSGFSKNASILPHRNSIFFLVIGFFNAFSSLVSHCKFSGRLFLQFVSLWSTT